MNKKNTLFFLLPVILSFILHVRVLKFDVIGYHVWRQSQTQTVIYNFTFSDNSIFHPQKFDVTTGTSTLLYEFPLYQWVIAQVNNCFGYSVLHTRLLSFLFFVFFLAGFYKLLLKFVSKPIALITNALVCFSPLLYYYCVNPLPDILALGFAAWSLNFFFAFVFSKQGKYFLLFSLFLMLSALVKLPYLLFGGVFLLYAYRAISKKQIKESLIKGLTLLLMLIPVFIWYAKAIPTWTGNTVTSGVLKNSASFLQLLDYFQFNLFSSVPELLTNYAACVFLFVGIFFFFKQRRFTGETHKYFILLLFLFSIYFLFELNLIGTTHDYYLMPFIPLLFLVVAFGVNYFYQKNYIKLLIFIVCLVPLTAWLRINPRWNPETPGFVIDYASEQKFFAELIPQNEKCIIDHDDSHFISLYYLKRQGFSLFKNEISAAVLKDRFLRGGNFLVTENLSLNLNDYPEFDLKELYSKNLKIYKLNLK